MQNQSEDNSSSLETTRNCNQQLIGNVEETSSTEEALGQVEDVASNESYEFQDARSELVDKMNPINNSINTTIIANSVIVSAIGGNGEGSNDTQIQPSLQSLPAIGTLPIEPISSINHNPKQFPQSQLPAVRSVGSFLCRICQSIDTNESLISPCLCKGSLGYVHKNCLEHWLNLSGILHCELCQFQFKTEQTLRYSCCQALRIWYKHPNNRGLAQSELLVCSLLTIVSFGLIAISVLGLQYFVAQGSRIGMSKVWTQGSIIVFMTIVTFVYIVNVFLILKSQLVPWYRWWQSARQIKIILYNKRIRKTKSKLPDLEGDIEASLPQTRSNDNTNRTVITLSRTVIRR